MDNKEIKGDNEPSLGKDFERKEEARFDTKPSTSTSKNKENCYDNKDSKPVESSPDSDEIDPKQLVNEQLQSIGSGNFNPESLDPEPEENAKSNGPSDRSDPKLYVDVNIGRS